MRPNLSWLLCLGAAACGPAGSANTGDAGAGDGQVASRTVRNDEYCAGAATPACMGREVRTCGVCVSPPTGSPRPPALARTNCGDTARREHCREGTVGAAAVACFDPASYPTPAASRMVNLWGTVRVFGNGGNSERIRITVYRAGPDGALGPMVGAAVSDLTAPGHGTEDVLSPSRDRVIQTRMLGAYRIADVPTETELIVLTEGDPSDEVARSLWRYKIYTYNVRIRNDEVDMPAPPAGVASPAVRFDPRVLSNGDWTAIPAAAGLVTGIPRGHGAIAGEVHDCDDVRLSNARVYSEPRPQWPGTVYFSDNDTNPLPDLSTERQQFGTSILGAYALLDLNPGPHTVAAVGYDAQGRLVHIGSYRVQVFPDSVTAVTLRGLRPWQVPRR